MKRKKVYHLTMGFVNRYFILKVMREARLIAFSFVLCSVLSVHFFCLFCFVYAFFFPFCVMEFLAECFPFELERVYIENVAVTRCAFLTSRSEPNRPNKLFFLNPFDL